MKATPEMFWTIFSTQHLVSVEPSCWQMWVTRGRLSCDVYLSLPPLTLWSSDREKLWLYFSMKNNKILAAAPGSWLHAFPHTVSPFWTSFSPATNLPPHCLCWSPSGVPLCLLCGFSPPTKSIQVIVIRNLPSHQLPPSCIFEMCTEFLSPWRWVVLLGGFVLWTVGLATSVDLIWGVWFLNLCTGMICRVHHGWL